MVPKKRKVNRSATDRLRKLIQAELTRQNLSEQEAAREARLPANAFRALRTGHRPSLDRAEELLCALGIAGFCIGIRDEVQDESSLGDDNAEKNTD